MVATVPFDVILSFGIGLGVAWTARIHLAAAPRLVPSRPLWAVTIFQLVVFCPIGAYLYVVHPDWSWNYFIDPQSLPGWFGIVAIGSYAVAGVAGFLVGGHLVRTDRSRRLLRILFGVAGVLGLYFLVFLRRFWWVGTYAAYHAGQTGMVSFTSSRLGLALGGVGPIFVGVLAWVLFREWRHGQRLVATDSRNP